MRLNYEAADGQSHIDPMRLLGKEAAAEVLTLIGEQGGDPMMAQLGMMLALPARPKPTPAPPETGQGLQVCTIKPPP